MAIDTAQKRMSAMNFASPWRGPLVDATETGFNAGNRQAALFMYAMAGAGSGGGTSAGVIPWLTRPKSRRTIAFRRR